MASNGSGVGDQSRVLRMRKVMRLVELQLHMKCSRRTVQRRLSDWHAISSYNLNGSYYTLPEIPDFDANGLWRYQGAFFSRFGNLPETFAHMVAEAPAGLTAGEAGELLGLRPSSFLWSLRDHPAIRREKHQGRYLYVSSDPVRCQAQKQQRERMGGAARLPTAAEAIAILIEKIKQPDLSHEQLSRRLEKQKVFVAAELIEDFFLRHDLAVKKTSRSV